MNIHTYISPTALSVWSAEKINMTLVILGVWPAREARLIKSKAANRRCVLALHLWSVKHVMEKERNTNKQ